MKLAVNGVEGELPDPATVTPFCLVCGYSCKWVRYEVERIAPGAIMSRWGCPNCEPSIFSREDEPPQ